MTRKNPPARYTLPADPLPDTSICVQIQIPNDPMHLAAFQGQVKALSRAYAWADDPDHTALLAAQAWQPVFDDLCLNPSPCGAEVPSILCISGDFADDTYGYAPAIAAPCSPDYVPGTGWQSCFDSSVGDIIYLIRPFDGATFVRSYTYHTDGTALFSYDIIVTFYLHGAVAYSHSVTFAAGGPGSIGDTPDVQADLVLVQVVHSTLVSDDTLTLKDWALCYTGDFPMSQPPTVWSTFLDFSVGLYGFSVNYGHQGAGGIISDSYFGADMVSGVEIGLSPAVHLLSAIMVYSMSGGGSSGDAGTRVGFVIGGTFQNTFIIHSGMDGTDRSFGGAMNDDVTLINCTCNTGNLTGSALIQSLALTGTGTKPAGWP